MAATFDQIVKDLKTGQYRPIYFLFGEEAYFIDYITDYIANHVLDESEQAFNQTVVYGRDTDAATVIEVAKRFPMMANHQVVIVREAQQMRKIEDLAAYVENPLSSTVLVLCYKYKKPDKRKAFFKALAKNSVFFESKKLYDNQIPAWINKYLVSKRMRISPKASVLLTEYLGTDLSKIANELDKLLLNLPEGLEITPQHIEENIGISREYNTFELQNALGKHDVMKANRIVQGFSQNPKQHPFVVTVSSLYNFFSKILTYHFLKDKSERSVASALRIHPFFVKDYQTASRYYNPRKTVEIIGSLREYDLKSKGWNNASTPDGELLRELVYKILH
ncbi:MAG: DNA polymerase III subunit delta [Salibacteraceae bacterium]